MKIYIDETRFKEFLDTVINDTRLASNKKKPQDEIRNFIRKYVEVRLLPSIEEQHEKRHNKNYLGHFSTRGKNKTERFNSFLCLSHRDKIEKWLKDGDTPYVDPIKSDDVISKYTSVKFSREKHDSEEFCFRDLSNLKIKDFINEIFIDKRFTTSKLFYTGEAKNWEDLIKCTLPITEIIIVDSYLFDTPKDEREPYSTYKLLDVLIGKNENVNVTFFCNPPKLKKTESNEVKPTPNYKHEFEELKNKYKEKNIKFRFITHYPHREDEMGQTGKLHDRYIITNNAIYMSGHSFARYFPNDRKSGCQAKGSVGFSLHYLLEPDTEKVLRSIFKNLSDNIIKHAIKGEIFGDSYEDSLFNVKNEDILNIEEWTKWWTTYLHEGKEVINKNLYEDNEVEVNSKRVGNKKYEYSCEGCCFLGTHNFYIKGKVKIKNIRLNDNKKYSYRFFANFEPINKGSNTSNSHENEQGTEQSQKTDKDE